MHFKPHRRGTCPVAQWTVSPWRDVYAAPSVWEAGARITEPGLGSLGSLPCRRVHRVPSAPRARCCAFWACTRRKGPGWRNLPRAQSLGPGRDQGGGVGASASRRHGRASRLTAPTRPPPFMCVLLHGGALASRQSQPFSRSAPSLLVRPDAPGRRVSGHRVLGGMGGASLPPAPRVRVF